MKKSLALSFIALTAALVSSLAQATDITLNWTPPTANSDGSTPALVSGFNIYQGTSDADLTAQATVSGGGKAVAVISSGGILTYTFKAVTPGTKVFAVSAYYCPTVGSAAGCQESGMSAHASTTVTAPVAVPGMPGNIQITATVSAPGS